MLIIHSELEGRFYTSQEIDIKLSVKRTTKILIKVGGVVIRI